MYFNQPQFIDDSKRKYILPLDTLSNCKQTTSVFVRLVEGIPDHNDGSAAGRSVSIIYGRRCVYSSLTGCCFAQSRVTKRTFIRPPKYTHTHTQACSGVVTT